MKTNIEDLLNESIQLLQQELNKKNRTVARTKHIVKNAAKLIQVPCTCGEGKANLCGCHYNKALAELAEKDVKKLR